MASDDGPLESRHDRRGLSSSSAPGFFWSPNWRKETAPLYVERRMMSASLSVSGLSRPASFRPLPKRTFPAFEDIADCFPDAGVFKTARRIGDWREVAGSVRPRAGHDDLIGIRVHHEIRVVCHQNNLPSALRSKNNPTNSSKIDLGSRFSSG